MRLDEYAQSGKYLKWTETDTHDLVLRISYDAFASMEAIFSDRHESEQYEIPVLVIADESTTESVLATKSKFLLVELLNKWKNTASSILRVKKQGTGFYTKWIVQESGKYYDKASGKIRSTPPKKK